jgi:hypothetical protein
VPSQKPVKVITDSDLEENGGVYKLQGGSAIRVRGSSSGGDIQGGSLTPVYVVSSDDINSGRFKLQGGFEELVSSEIVNRPVSGHVAIPVWAANSTEWPVVSFLPSDISGLILWLDSSDSSTLWQDTGATIPTANGDPVGRWDDKSVNGNNYTQSTSSDRPTLDTSLINGNPGLSFDGLDDKLIGPSIDLNEYTIVTVITTPSGGQQPIWSNRDGISNHLYYGWAASKPLAFLISAVPTQSVNGGSTIGSGTNLVVTFTGGTTDATFYVDSTEHFNVSTNFSSTGSHTNSYIGLDFTSSQIWSSNIGSILIYDHVLSESDRNDLIDYLMTQWGI